MSQRTPLDSFFDTSVGSGSSKLDELLGIRPITEEERAANRARYEEPTPEIPSMQGDAREKMAWAKQYLESKGLPSHLAAGALGNVMAESGGRTSAVGDAGASVGAFQWQKERLHGGGGYTGLIPYAKAAGSSPYDLKTQLDYFLDELQGPEKKAYLAALNTKTPEEAAAALAEHYERPAGKDYSKRMAYARQIAGGTPEGMLDVSNPNSPAAQYLAPPAQPAQPAMVPVLLSTGETINVDPNHTLDDVARILKDNGEDAIPMRGFQTVQGEVINVPYTMGDEDIMHTLRRDAPELTVAKGEPVPDYTSLGAAGKQALKSSLGQLGLGGAELAKAVGAEGIAKTAEEWARQKQKEAAGAFEMPTEEQAGFIKRKVGIPLVQAGAGIVPILPAMAVPGVGGLATAAGLMGTQELGVLKERAEAEGKDFKLGEAAPYAAAAGAVNLLPWGRIAPLFRAASEDAILGSREAIRAMVAKEGVEATQQKLGGYVGQALKNAGLAEAEGATADIATSVLERAYTDKPLWDKSAYEEYADVLAQGAPFYAVAGAGAGVAGRHMKATELEKIKEQEAAKTQIGTQKLRASEEDEGVEVPEGAPEVARPKLPFEIPEELQSLPLRDALNVMESRGDLPPMARDYLKMEVEPYASKIQGPEPTDAGGGERPKGGEEIGYPTEGGEGVRVSDQISKEPTAEGKVQETVTPAAPLKEPLLFTWAKGQYGVLDEEAIHRKALEKGPVPIDSGGGMSREYEAAFGKHFHQKAQEYFAPGGGYEQGNRFRVNTRRGSYIFKTLDDAKDFAEKYGMKKGTRRTLDEYVPEGAEIKAQKGVEAPKVALESFPNHLVTAYEKMQDAYEATNYSNYGATKRAATVSYKSFTNAVAKHLGVERLDPAVLEYQRKLGQEYHKESNRLEGYDEYGRELPADIQAVSKNPDQGRLPLDVAKFEDTKTGKDILERYLQHSTHKELGALAEQLLQSPYAKDVGVSFVRTGDVLPTRVAQSFRGANAISETDASGSTAYYRADDPSAFTEHTLVHEVVHGLTQGSLNRNPTARRRLDDMSGAITRALENSVKHPSATPEAKNATQFWRDHIHRDPAEALAYGLTSPTFRQLMQQYTADGKPITEAMQKLRRQEAEFHVGRKPEAPKQLTLWDKFWDFMRKLVGMPEKNRAAFEKALDDYHQRVADRKARIEELAYMKPALTDLEESLQALLKTTEAEGIALPDKKVYAQVAKQIADDEEIAREVHKEQPDEIGLAGELRERSFSQKFADGARDIFKEGRRTSFTSEWLDMYDDLGKATKDRPMMVDGKAAVDMVASAYAQAGNLLTDAVHNGSIMPNGDGTWRVQKNPNVALERIYRDITEAGKAEKFNNMLVGLVARTIRAEDQKKKDTAANYEVMADDLRAAARRTKDAKKKASFIETAESLEGKAEEITKLFQNQYESRTWATDEQVKMAEALEASDPQLANEAQNVYSLLRTCVDNLESSGVINKEFADFCRTRPNYIPLYKNMENELQKDFDSMLYDPTNHALVDAFRSSMRSTKRQPGIKQQKRHFHEVMVEANLLKHLAMTTMMSMRNDLNKAFAEQLSVAGSAERVKHKEQADLTVMENGEPQYYKVYDKQALFALMGAQPLVNPIFRQLKKVSNLVRGVMVMNPLFWFRQLVREPLTASAVARVGMVTPFDTMKELTKIMANKSEWYEKLQRRGIVAAQDVITDPVEFSKYVSKDKGWVIKGVDQVKKIHEAVDGATRAVVADKAYKQAISEGFSPKDAENIAAIKAREIINFARQGRSELARTMRAVTPFFGAALNGLHVAAKAMAPEKIGRLSKAEAMEQRRIFYTRAALVAMYTSAYAMAMSDDEDYLKATDRASNWLIPTGDKDQPFIKEPIQFELGALLKTIPEAITLANMGVISTKRAAKEVGKTVMDTVIPPFPMIYAVKPLAEAAMNFDFHNWAPIESRGDSEKLPYLRDRRAGELMKDVAKELHGVGIDAEVLSPDRMERVMEGYFGQVWGLARVASDYALYNGPEKPEKILADQPFFKGVLVKGAKDKAVEDFYDVYEEVKQFSATESAARTKGNAQLMQTLKDDPKFKTLMQAKDVLKETMDQMNEISANIERVTNNIELDKRVKKQRIDKLTEDRNRVAAKGVRLARQFGFEI